MELIRYSEEVDAKLQTKRISGVIGSIVITALIFFMAVTVPGKAPGDYQLAFMIFFQSACVIGFFAVLGFLFLWIINLQNGSSMERDKIQELIFYARQDSDIALFLDEIREKEDRLPVLDEYVQILMVAHKKNLPIYHEYLKGREAGAY